MSTYDYRSCSACKDGAYTYDEKEKPVVSLLVLVSTVRDVPRRQKSSGALAMCPDCLAKILDGEPLPQKIRDGMAEACKQIGVEVQRALPLDAKPTKKRKAAK